MINITKPLSYISKSGARISPSPIITIREYDNYNPQFSFTNEDIIDFKLLREPNIRTKIFADGGKFNFNKIIVEWLNVRDEFLKYYSLNNYRTILEFSGSAKNKDMLENLVVGQIYRIYKDSFIDINNEEFEYITIKNITKEKYYEKN